MKFLVFYQTFSLTKVELVQSEGKKPFFFANEIVGPLQLNFPHKLLDRVTSICFWVQIHVQKCTTTCTYICVSAQHFKAPMQQRICATLTLTLLGPLHVRRACFFSLYTNWCCTHAMHVVDIVVVCCHLAMHEMHSKLSVFLPPLLLFLFLAWKLLTSLLSTIHGCNFCWRICCQGPMPSNSSLLSLIVLLPFVVVEVERLLCFRLDCIFSAIERAVAAGAANALVNAPLCHMHFSCQLSCLAHRHTHIHTHARSRHRTLLVWRFCCQLCLFLHYCYDCWRCCCLLFCISRSCWVFCCFFLPATA